MFINDRLLQKKCVFRRDSIKPKVQDKKIMAPIPVLKLISSKNQKTSICKSIMVETGLFNNLS